MRGRDPSLFNQIEKSAGLGMQHGVYLANVGGWRGCRYGVEPAPARLQRYGCFSKVIVVLVP